MSEIKYQHRDAHEDEIARELNSFLFLDLMPRCYTKICDLDVRYALSEEPVPFAQKDKLSYRPIKVGEIWSDHIFQCAWFHLQCHLPDNVPHDRLFLSFDCSGEGLLVDKEGHAVKGFTNGTYNFGQYNYPAWQKSKYPWNSDKGDIDCYIDCGSNGLQGGFKNGVLLDASLVQENPKTKEVFYDYYILLDALVNQPRGKNYNRVLEILRHVRDLYVYGFAEPDKTALELLKPLFHLNCFPKDHFRYTAIGHAHLDLIWLWPERETHRKALRTFANAIYLLRKYPDYTFAVSQPQQLEWVKQEDPKLFADILYYAKEGRIEPVGGGWVENDTNLIGEESMTRQELYGQKFWLENFGHTVSIRWLPDTFGYNAANPQVFRLANEPYFMTIKISWCDRTIFPYHTFHWQGIDGSSVLVHMPPEGDYNSLAKPSNLFLGEHAMKPCDGKKEALLVYGIGDGGAGPSEIHIEGIRREEDVPYLPKVKMGTALSFFETIDEQKNLPTYQGEMYLEKHRGTYTSQSENKQNNRRFEEQMRSLEFLLSSERCQDEKTVLDQLWKRGLFYQFHDSLPGSGIQRIYQEADQEYKSMLARIESLVSRRGYSFSPKTGDLLMNHLSYPVRHFVKIGSTYVLYEGGGASAIAPRTLSKRTDLGNISSLETEQYLLQFDKNDGHILFLKDKKSNRKYLKEANRLRVFIDRGDGWDFPEEYRDQPEVYMTLKERSVQDYGELFEVLSVYSYRESILHERVTFDKKTGQIEFHHDLDWKNLNTMLRSESIPGVYAAVVHNDIPFGMLDRSTKNDTDHHKAQYEMCCYKWLDVSSSRQGVSFLNATKNGYYAKQGMVSLHLLRSTNYPCVNGDLKPTSYAYAFVPHEGAFSPIWVDQKANAFNAAFLFGTKPFALPAVTNQAIEISCFKPSYDGKHYILRLYEKSGQKAKTALTLPNGMHLSKELNLLEDVIGEAPEKDISFSPFQIRTFQVD